MNKATSICWQDPLLKLPLPAGASFPRLLAGNSDDWCRYGYGFKIQLKELLRKNKAGKLLISLPDDT